MTTEIPWAAEGSDKNSSSHANDALESLGFTFSEESSGQAPGRAQYVDVATAALEEVPAGRSTDLVPMSRRALREAERSQTGARRARRGSADESHTARSVPAASTVAPQAPAAWAASTAPPTGFAATPPAALASAPAFATASASAPRVSLRRRIAKKTFPPVVMLAAAALLVGTSVPATALFDPDAPPASTVMASIASVDSEENPELTEEQVVDVDTTGEITAAVASRDDWSVTSYAEMLRLKYGNRDFSYSTSGSGAVRWPFPAAVPISSGFGERVAPCRYCSSYHQGLDFNPGSGTPIFAIADGVVIKAEHSGGFGNHAIIEHTINGQRVTSTYAHMTRDSSPLVVGQQILVGDFVGTVGSTGTSTGAHLHFEIRIDDIAIDPFAWLQANAS